MARLNDVHAFGYNSAGSERIWMQFVKLRVYCLDLFLTNFGRDPRRSSSGSASRIFVFFFCPLNNARFHRLLVSQISRNLHNKTCFRLLCGALEFCEYLPVRVFPPKTSILAWSKSTISDFRPRFFSETIKNLGKSWQVGTPVECWLSIDTVGKNSKWFPWHVTPAHGEQFFPKNTLLRRP